MLGTGLRREKALNPVRDLLHLSILRVNDHIIFCQGHQLLQVGLLVINVPSFQNIVHPACVPGVVLAEALRVVLGEDCCCVSHQHIRRRFGADASISLRFIGESMHGSIRVGASPRAHAVTDLRSAEPLVGMTRLDIEMTLMRSNLHVMQCLLYSFLTVHRDSRLSVKVTGRAFIRGLHSR